MILEYKGYNNNWCYEEASVISWAFVSVDKEIESVKNKFNGNTLNLEAEIRIVIETKIRNETMASSDYISFMIGKTPISELTNICVVILNGKDLNETYVFLSGVYLLNNSGGTVQRIA